MSILSKVLVAKENPAKTYLRALDLVGLDYECSFSPDDLSKFSGLLLVGGGDIFSFLYGKTVSFSQENLLRDCKEFALFDYFYSKGLPVLGICRGFQLINVYFGGTLKNLPSHQSSDGKDVFHTVEKNGSKVFKNFLFVNSNHHQSVDKLCDNADNVLYSTDGTVEGFTVGNCVIATHHVTGCQRKSCN